MITYKVKDCSEPRMMIGKEGKENMEGSKKKRN